MADVNTNVPTTTTPQEPAHQDPNSAAPDYDAIFQKLDAILDKRADGIARSALKDNGVSDEEIKGIVAAYRQQKEGAAQKQADTFSQLQSENKQLKDQILQVQLQSEAMKQAEKLNVAPETVPYLLKLANLDGAVGKDGKIQADVVTEALNKVLADLPALKKQNTQSGGFIAVGANAGGQASAAEDDKLRAAFGLKK